MSTKAGTIGIAGRRTGLIVWTGIVSALAAAALILSAMALIEARDNGSIADAASKEQVEVGAQAPLWDAGKLEAMKGRVLAEDLGDRGYVLWDAHKLEAMQGRVLAASIGSHGYALWDDGKIEAMHGRALAG